MSIYINKCDLYNELGKIPAPAGASDSKAEGQLAEVRNQIEQLKAREKELMKGKA